MLLLNSFLSLLNTCIDWRIFQLPPPAQPNKSFCMFLLQSRTFKSHGWLIILHVSVPCLSLGEHSLTPPSPIPPLRPQNRDGCVLAFFMWSHCLMSCWCSSCGLIVWSRCHVCPPIPFVCHTSMIVSALQKLKSNSNDQPEVLFWLFFIHPRTVVKCNISKSQALYSAQRGLKTNNTAVFKVGAILINIPQHPATLHSMMVRSSHQLSKQISDLIRQPSNRSSLLLPIMGVSHIMLFLGLIIAFGGITRMGLHACILKKTPYYSHCSFQQNQFQHLKRSVCIMSPPLVAPSSVLPLTERTRPRRSPPTSSPACTRPPWRPTSSPSSPRGWRRSPSCWSSAPCWTASPSAPLCCRHWRPSTRWAAWRATAWQVGVFEDAHQRRAFWIYNSWVNLKSPEGWFVLQLS